MENQTAKSYLEATIQRIDGDRAVLLLPDGQVVRWPVSMLSAGAKPGEVVHIGVDAGAGEQKSSPSTIAAHDLAHEVLNTIFGVDTANL